MNGIKLIIFDADGTLRQCTVDGQPCPNNNGEWELYPGIREKLLSIDFGFPNLGQIAYGIASNQAGIAYGYLSENTARDMLESLAMMCFRIIPHYETIQICSHSVDYRCKCRKPGTLMLEKIMKAWGISDVSSVLFVGDMESDEQTATNLGCNFMYVNDFINLFVLR